MGSSETAPEIITHRIKNQSAVIIFVHGFTGSTTETWGQFPHLLVAKPALNQWDVVSLGYFSTFAPDFRGVWRADAPIDRLANLLITRVKTDLRSYKAIAFLAHSMGGLVVQRALVDDAVGKEGQSFVSFWHSK